MGYIGDSETQMAVLRATLNAFQDIDVPGTVVDLPFEWPEHLKDKVSGPHQPPPITSYLMKHPLQFKKLLARSFPE